MNFSLDDPDYHMPHLSTGIRVRVTNKPQEVRHLAQSTLRVIWLNLPSGSFVSTYPPGIFFQISGWGRAELHVCSQDPGFSFHMRKYRNDKIYLAWATSLWAPENQLRESSRGLRSLLCPEACLLVGLFQVILSSSVANLLSSSCLEWAAGVGLTDVWIVNVRTLKEAVVGPQAVPTIPYIEGIHHDGQ